MKRIFTLLTFIAGFYFQSNAQLLPTGQCESNPCNALSICGTNTITQPNSFTSTGVPNSTAPLAITTCLNQTPATNVAYNGNWVFYKITCNATGALNFTITANDAASNIDWALWNITTSGCSNLTSGNVVECNTSTTLGQTGIAAVAATNFEPSVTITAGSSYILGVSRKTGGTVTTGFTINFTGTTANITDNIAPTMASIVPVNTCAPVTSVQVKMSEPVRCLQIQNSDFTITNNPAFTATGNNCNGCTNSAPNVNVGTNISNLSDTINFNFPTALAPGNYTISLNSPNAAQPFFDNCGNVANIVPTVSFTVPVILKDSVSFTRNCITNVWNATSCGVNGISPYQYKVLSPSGVAPFNGVYGASTTSCANYTGLTGGITYTFTVRDASGCERDTIVTPPLYLNLNTPNVSVFSNPPCSNQFALDSLFIPSQSGGLAPYTFTLTPPAGATTGTFTPPSLWKNLVFPGSVAIYTVTVQDAAGCSRTALRQFVNPLPLVLPTITFNNAGCFGDSTGNFTAAATGGTPILTYSSSPFYAPTMTQGGPLNNFFNNVPAGTYTVTVTDDKSCTATNTVTLGSNPQIVIKTANIPLPVTFVNPTCLNPCMGTIKPTATGGVGSAASKKFYLLPLVSPGIYSDSIINVAGIFDSLCAGTYTVICKDLAGCTATATYTLALPPIPNLVLDSVNNIPCFAGCNGQIFTTLTGGTAPFTYSLTPNPNPPCGPAVGVNGDYSNLPAGTYKIVVTSSATTTLGGGCADSIDNITISQPPSAITMNSVLADSVTCFGLSTGTITATASGGTGLITYTIAPNGPAPNTTGVFNNLIAQTYTITATDVNGCSTTQSIVVSQPDLLTAVGVTLTNATCNGLCNGTASVTPTGGNGGYTYSVTGPGSPTFNNSGLVCNLSTLCSGTYTVTISDTKSCSTTVTVSISQPSLLTASQSNLQNVSCFGLCDGSVDITPAGGTLPYSYVISSPGVISGTGNASVLCFGSYTITVSDFNLCTTSVLVNISEPAVLSPSISNITNATCNGICNGSAQAGTTGGTLPYVYSISGGGVINPTTGAISGLCAGPVYTVTVTDFNLCSTTITVSVTEPPILTATGATTFNVSCFGLCDGTGTVTVSGGTLPYTYVSILGPGTPVISTGGVASNLCVGTYIVNVTDANLCTTTATIMITEPSQLNSSTTVVSQVSCFGLCDGEAQSSASGGTPPYSYTSITPTGVIDPTTGVASGLCAGSYVITTTDDNGCTSTSSVTITEPALLVASVVMTQAPTCTPGCDGTAQVSAVGGTMAYVYSSIAPGGVIDPTTGVASGLCAGIQYTITVTDNNNCTATTVITLTTPGGPTLSTSNQVNASCFGLCDGSINASALGNSPYTWSIAPSTPSSVTITSTGLTTSSATGLCAGTYVISASDANSCVGTISLTITEPGAITPSISNIVNATCNGICNGSAQAGATGGTLPYTYSISGGGVIDPTTGAISGLCAGPVYTVTVTDFNLCSTTITVSVTEPPILTATGATTFNVSCFGLCDGTGTVTVSGGTLPYTYVSILGPGTPVISTGGVASNLCDGTYTINVTDANLCTATATITITEPSQLNSSTTVVSQVSCFGLCDGEAQSSASGGTPPYSFTSITPTGVIDPTTGVASGLCAGSYVITTTDDNGCTSTSSVTITEPALLVASVVMTQAPTCTPGCDGTAQVSAVGGTMAYVYSSIAPGGVIDPTTGVASGLCAGIQYTITVTDNNNCTATTVITLTTPGGPTLSTSNQVNASCFGLCDGSINASALGNSPYTWSIAPSTPSSVTITSTGLTTSSATGLCAGTYVISASDANSCVGTISLTITEPGAITPSISNIVNATCNGICNGSAQAGATGGTLPYTYSISGGGVIDPTTGAISGLCAGPVYTVTVTDFNLCSTTITVSVTEPPILTATGATTFNVSCFGLCDGTGTVTVSGGTLPYTYVSILGPGTPVISTGGVASNLCDGTYTINVTDANLCTATATITITEPSQLNSSTTVVSQVSCFGLCDGEAQSSASGGTPPYSFTSITPTGVIDPTTGVASGLCAGSYVITTTDDNGCTSTSSVTITEPALLVASVVMTQAPTCTPGCDGTAQVSAVGGTMAYVYSSIAPGGVIDPTTGVASGLCAGIQYTITVTDNNNCTATTVITLTTPGGPVVSIASQTDPSCNPGCDGLASVSTLGGSLPYTYTIDNGGTIDPLTGAASNLCAGILYTITVEDINSCANITTVQLNQPSALPIDTVSTTLASCVPGCDGSAIMTPSVNMTYSIVPSVIPPIVGNTITGLCANTLYTVTGTDNNGCTSTMAFSIGTANGPAIPTVTATTDASCNPGCDGSVTLSNAGLNYTISPTVIPAIVGNTITGLCANTLYTITGSDVNGCSVQTTVQIGTQSALPIDTVSTTLASCVPGCDGSAIMTPSVNMTYTIVPSVIPPIVGNTITGLCANTLYTVTGTDNNGCTSTMTFSIGTANGPAIPTVTATTDASCNPGCDGSVTLSNAGLNYTISPTVIPAIVGNTITGLCANTLYTITGSDVNGCSVQTTVQIGTQSALPIDTVSTTLASCVPGCDGSAIMTPSVNMTYTIVPSVIPPIVGNTITGLCANTLYTVTGTDNNGCTSTMTFSIGTANGPAIPTVTATTDASCNPGCDGSVTLSNAGLNYTISPTVIPAIVGNTITGLCANTLYTITGSDVNGCSVQTTVQIGTQSALPIDTVSTTLASCVPGCDGSAIMTPSVNMTYSIVPLVIPPIVGNTITGLCANTLYTVTGTDNNGCTSTMTFSIGTANGPAIPTVTATTDASCNPGCDGSVTLSNAGLNYTISPTVIPAIVGNTITGLCANTLYTITGSDVNGCSVQTTAQIGTQSALPIDTVSTTLASCVPGCDGSAIMTPSVNMTYSIVPLVIPPIVGNTITGLCANTLYTVTGTDNNGCTSTMTFSIGTANGPAIPTVTATTNASCNPGCDGSVTLSNAGLNYTISPTVIPAIVGNTITGLCANTLYTITGSDVNGCSVQTTVQVSSPTALPISVASTTEAGCDPGCDGTVTMALIAGNNYTVSPAGPTFVGINGTSFCANILYTITGTDVSGCTTTVTVQIGTTTSPTVSAISTNPTQAGTSNGTITATGAVGTPPYQYSLNGGTPQVSNIFTGLSGNTLGGANCYTITVIDSKGCTGSTVQCIFEPGDLLFNSVVKTDETCLGACDGTITVSAVGGVSPLIYSIAPGTINSTTGVATGLCATTYIVTVTDANNVNTTTSIVINPGTQITFNTPTITNPSCNPGCDGIISITSNGGVGTVTYTIQAPAGNTCSIAQPTSGNFTNIGTGNYVITASDINGCTATTLVNMAPSSGPTIVSIDTTTVTCNALCNGGINVTATNANTYTLNNGTPQASNIFNGLCAGTYNITVTSANGCTVSSSVIVSEPSAITLVASSFTNPLCFGSNTAIATLNVTGGTGTINYSISPTPVGIVQSPAGTFNNLPGGTYTITAVDQKQCSYSYTYVITAPAELVWNTASFSNITCFGLTNGNINVVATGGTPAIEYSIDNGLNYFASGLFNNLSANTYTVIAKDANNCSITTSFTILEPPVLSTSNPITTNNVCNGQNIGSITVNGIGGTPGYTYTITPQLGNQLVPGVFTDLPAGNYSVEVEDASGCTTVASGIIITQPAALVFNPINVQNVACFGQNTGSITATAFGGTGLINYSIDPVAASSSPGFFTNLFAGTYTITITDANACSLSTVVTVTENPLLQIANVVITQPICKGDANGSMDVTAIGGVSPYQFALNGPPFQSSGLFTGLTAKSYNLTIQDLLGCTRDTVVTVTEPDAVGAVLTITNTTCIDSKDGKLIVEGTGGRGGYKYYVTPGLRVNKSGIFSGFEASTYTIRVVDTAGCEYETLFTINPPSNPISNVITKQDLGCYGKGNEGQATANVSGGTPPYTYLWFTTPIQTTQTASELYFGFYEMQVTDANGCVVKDTIQIQEGPCCDVSFIPNAFSPNGDGNNDEFRVLTTAGIQLQQLEIYDRWGKRVWSTNDYRRGWNGTIDGDQAPVSTYHFVFRYKCLTDQKNYIKKGDVILVR